MPLRRIYPQCSKSISWQKKNYDVVSSKLRSSLLIEMRYGNYMIDFVVRQCKHFGFGFQALHFVIVVQD